MKILCDGKACENMSDIYTTDNNITITEEQQKQWKTQLNKYKRLYLYAPSGYGKSSTVEAFAQRQFSEWKLISAEREFFLELTEKYIDKNKHTRVRTLLVLDDLQWLVGEVNQNKLVALLNELHAKDSKLQCVLISRAPLPVYLKPFYLTRQLVVEKEESLWLSERQIQAFLRKESLTGYEEEAMLLELAKKSKMITKGYPIAVCSFARLWKEGIRDLKALDSMIREDIFQYYDRTLFTSWTSEQKEALLKLAVYDNFNLSMAEIILGESAKEMVEGIARISSFFQYTPPDVYKIHPFFLQYLRIRQNTLSKEERSVLYYKAGQCYETKRELKQALSCYKQAGQSKKIAELVICLSENVDGDFIKSSEEYLKELPEEFEERYPKLLASKALLYSYQMRIEESNRCLTKLKKMVVEEKKRGKRGDVLKAYVRVLVAIPHGNSQKVKEKLRFLSVYMLKHGFHLSNVIPTGNMPSVINGGLDYISWANNDRLLYPIMKRAVEIALGTEAVGLADVCMGENLYEKNKRTEAMGYLTKGLSDANFKGSIRVQFAAVGVMARVFQSEGQVDTAEGTLLNILKIAEESNLNEIIPNIRASLVSTALLKGNDEIITEWLEKDAPDEHEKFYITDRFRLFTKARVYVSIGRDVEALYILNMLLEYTNRYERNYLRMEINILKSILLYRRQEEWMELFITTVKKAASYSYVHILSDQGGAILPLWREVDWSATGIHTSYVNDVLYELKRMDSYYGNYLQEKQEAEVLTKKEIEVVELMAKGFHNSEIAIHLSISTATVKFHIANIRKKLNVDHRILIVKKAQEINMIK